MAPRRQLEDSIAHLRSELSDHEPLSEADRTLLERTLADVAQLLDHEQDDPSFGEPIYKELQELASRLEGVRQNLSVVVGRVVDALSQLGI